MKSSSSSLTLCLLAVAVAVLAMANVYCGSVHIPMEEVTRILRGGEAARQSWMYIIFENRIPQVVTAMLAGAGLAAAGLMLQTALRNPLAGPNILGIDAGANLGVAIVMLLLGGSLTAGAFTLSGFVLVIVAAMLGAWAVMAVLLMLLQY